MWKLNLLFLHFFPVFPLCISFPYVLSVLSSCISFLQVRPFIVFCYVTGLDLTGETLKKFISLQTKWVLSGSNNWNKRQSKPGVRYVLQSCKTLGWTLSVLLSLSVLGRSL